MARPTDPKIDESVADPKDILLGLNTFVLGCVKVI